MKPYQTDASKPAKPDSAMVGASGKMGLRPELSTASTRSFPALAWGSTSSAFTATTCTWPASTSLMANAPPL